MHLVHQSSSAMILHAKHMLVVIFVCCFTSCYAASPAEWRNRTIYQVFTDRFARTDGSTTASCPPGHEGYCGGSWKGIISKLDYIQDMGFTAIWISPVVKQVSDETRAYNGYSAIDIYALNNNFGTASDLTDLATALHDRGMYLMIDVVANHMAYEGTAETVVYSSLNPFNKQDYFHDVCWVNDYNNQTDVEDCWLGTDSYPLPDLDTTSTDVRDMFSSWVTEFVSNYSADGLRVDTVKNVEKEFWSLFNSASGIYNLGEVSNGNVDYFCPYQDYMDGLIDYPTYYQATKFFSNTSATSENFLNQIQSLNSSCNDTTLLGTFSENHDQPRFASYTSDKMLAKNIITYTMLADGIPIIYQGQEQHFSGGVDPYNREAVWLSGYPTHSDLYKAVKNLNLIRSAASNQSSTFLTSKMNAVYTDANTIAFRKGDDDLSLLTVVSNLGKDSKDRKVKIPAAGFAANAKVTDVINCKSVKADSDGGIEVKIKSGKPMVFYPRSLLEGTDLCKGMKSAATSTHQLPLYSVVLAMVVWCLFYHVL